MSKVTVVNVQTGERTERDMTPKEIAAIPPQPDPRIAILAQINAIERETMVPRVTREFMILVAQREAVRIAAEMTEAGTPTTAEQILAENVGYQRALAVEAQIQALRERL